MDNQSIKNTAIAASILIPTFAFLTFNTIELDASINENHILHNNVVKLNAEYDNWLKYNPSSSIEESKSFLLSEASNIPDFNNLGLAFQQDGQQDVCVWSTSSNRNNNSFAITPETKKADCTNMTVIKAPEGTVKPETKSVSITETVKSNEQTSLEYSAPEPHAEFPWVIILSILFGGGIVFGGGAGILFGVKKSQRKHSLLSDSEAKWEDLLIRHDNIRKFWASYEIDPMKMLDYPILSDISEKVTSDLTRTRAF